MYKSESIINNLLLEVDSLTYRLQNIERSYCNTLHKSLRERLISENQSVLHRVKEILSIAKTIDERTKEKLSFSRVLIEKCRRTINETKIERNLFFL